jgi:zinc protease
MKTRFLRIKISLLAILGLVGSIGTYAQGTPAPHDMAKRVMPSVVVLEMTDPTDGSTSLGTGFFVDRSTIATAYNVVEGKNLGFAKVIGDTARHRITSIRKIDESADLALLSLETAIGVPLFLADDNSGQVGDEIFAVGSPRGQEGTFSQGIISGIRRSTLTELLQITAAISPGSVGGPVVDTQGKVLGVAVTYHEEGQVLNFAVPVRVLRILLQSLAGTTVIQAPAVPGPVKPSRPRSPAPTEALRTRLGAGSVVEFDVNGLKVIVKNRPAAPTVAAGLFIRGGSTTIIEKTAGIDNLMLESAIEAGKQFPRQVVRREIARTGSSISAGVSRDYGAASLASTRQNFDRVWAIFTDVMMNPAFMPEDVERNRQLILTGLRNAELDPDAALQNLTERTLYAGHPYANDPSGTVENITAFTIEDLKRRHREVMQTSRLLLVVVGDIEADKLRSLVAASFGKLPRGDYRDAKPQPLDFSKATLDTVRRSIPTNYIQGIFSAPPVSSKDMYAMTVAIEILKSRVFEEVRNRRSLSYAPDAFLREQGVNVAGIYVSAVDANQSIRLMLAEIDRLKTEPISERELEGIAGFFLTTHYLTQETNAAQAATLARYELIGGGWRNSFNFLEGVRNVTAADVMNVAKKYIGNVRFAFVGDPNAADRSVFLRN